MVQTATLPSRVAPGEIEPRRDLETYASLRRRGLPLPSIFDRPPSSLPSVRIFEFLKSLGVESKRSATRTITARAHRQPFRIREVFYPVPKAKPAQGASAVLAFVELNGRPRRPLPVPQAIAHREAYKANR
jgi:hypothetical protein